MEFWVIFAAVVLVGQAAKVPQQVTHPDIVPVPSEVLAAPPPPTNTSKDPHKTLIPAQVVEVAKDHVVEKNEMKKVMTTMKPETKTMMPTVAEISSVPPQHLAGKELRRKTRAVPFTNNERIKQHTAKYNDMADMMKDKWTQRNYKMVSHRSMRSVKAETTTNPAVNIKSSDSSTLSSPSAMSTIDPCDLLCTKFEFEPICASNGLCLHEFPNQCILETYNCKHPKGKFAATKDDSCQMNWLIKCDESEMI